MTNTFWNHPNYLIHFVIVMNTQWHEETEIETGREFAIHTVRDRETNKERETQKDTVINISKKQHFAWYMSLADLSQWMNESFHCYNQPRRVLYRLQNRPEWVQP